MSTQLPNVEQNSVAGSSRLFIDSAGCGFRFGRVKLQLARSDLFGVANNSTKNVPIKEYQSHQW